MLASLPWLIPSLLNPVHASPSGVAAFAARSDSPFGAAVSLLMLGGIWNAQAVPAGYGGAVSACWLAVVVLAAAGYAFGARPRRICPGLGVAGVLGFFVACLGLTALTRAWLRDAITFWPGFALLRDGQQFLAPLALTLAVGLGAGTGALITAARAPGSSRLIKAGESAAGPVSRAGRSRRRRACAAAARTRLGRGQPAAAGPVSGRLAAGSPAHGGGQRERLGLAAAVGAVPALPVESRGGRVRSVAALHRQADDLERRPARRPDHGPAESERARRLAPVIDSGRPRTAALVAAGVRYVIVDAGSLLGDERGARGRLAALARLPAPRCCSRAAT